MENTVICRAKFKSTCLVLIIIYVIIFCLVNYLALETEDRIEYEVDKNASAIHYYVTREPGFIYNYDKKPEYRQERYLLWGRLIAEYTYDVRADIDRTEGYSWKSDYCALILFFLIVPPIPVILVIRNKSKKSKLELTDDGIIAVHKKMLSTENIKLTIDKVENAIVKKSLYNFLTGGQTIVICTSSGNYKFPWVRNADEFVDAALAKIKEAK